MVIIACIIVSLFAILGSKYVFMFSLTPLIKYWNRKEQKWYALSVSNKKQKDTSITSGNKTSNSQKAPRRIKTLLTKIITGYERYYIIQVGYIPSHTVRQFLYRNILGADIKPTATIYYGAEIRAPYNLHIGNGSIIGDKSLLDARNGIYIGDNVNFSSNVSIYTQQHDHRAHDFGCSTGIHSKVVIEDRAWIGPNVIILPGVHIGEGAVVGAGAVVTKDIAPFTINAGIPAKVVGERTKDIDYVFSGNHSMFY